MNIYLIFYTNFQADENHQHLHILIPKNLTWKNEVESKIIEILNTGLADETFKFIVNSTSINSNRTCFNP